ncbi:MAG: YjjG family noncanonical pyrimidine nucleotidase [Flavobacteriales bacterium]
MKKYTHLFFDLDGTLWDLKRNTRAAMEELFQRHNQHIGHLDFENFYNRYHHHNDHVWALYRQDKIKKDELRFVRFDRTFRDLNHPATHEFVDRFSLDFLEVAPRQPLTMEGAHELLDHCKDRYELHIITNGFVEVQGHKMKAASLEGYFRHIINSEHVGVRKPHPEIFRYALEKASASKEESLMIGDDWDADILGARDFGIDQAFLTASEEEQNALNASHGNKSVRHNYKPTYTLHSLLELKDIL